MMFDKLPYQIYCNTKYKEYQQRWDGRVEYLNQDLQDLQERQDKRGEEWKNGRMEEWKNGRMEEWKRGLSEPGLSGKTGKTG